MTKYINIKQRIRVLFQRKSKKVYEGYLVRLTAQTFSRLIAVRLVSLARRAGEALS